MLVSMRLEHIIIIGGYADRAEEQRLAISARECAERRFAMATINLDGSAVTTASRPTAVMNPPGAFRNSVNRRLI